MFPNVFVSSPTVRIPDRPESVPTNMYVCAKIKINSIETNKKEKYRDTSMLDGNP